MTIKIIFFKSSSKYYDTVCLQSETFDSYTQNQSTNTLILSLDDLRENQNTIKNILEIIKHWTRTEYYLDNAKVSLQCIESFMTILDCEKKCNECVINNEYCYVQAGWGCKFINSISLRRESYYSYNSNLAWYEFGHFVDDEWIIPESVKLNCFEP